VFNTAGTYNYDCSVGSMLPNGMVGQINVEGLPSIMDIVTESEAHYFRSSNKCRGTK